MSQDDVAVRNQVDAFVNAFNAGDAAKLAALFCEDAEFVNIFGAWMRGRAGIEAGHARAFASILGKTALGIAELQVKRLGSEVALCHVRWTRGTLAGADATALAPGGGMLSLVATRQADGWLFASGHNTQQSTPPGKP